MMRAFLGTGLGLVVLVGCTGEGHDPFPSSSSGLHAGPGSASSSGATGGGGSGGSTSSSGGNGGGGASSSSSSSGGCTMPSECPAGGPCAPAACSGGQCTTIPLVAGTVVPDGTPGNCEADVCDGAGGVVHVASAADVPNDGNDCTTDTCDGFGSPKHTNVAAGAPCANGGGKVCDGQGKCAECLSDTDCPGSGTCADLMDQVTCDQNQGCKWDSFDMWCYGTPVGTCQGGACAP